MKVIQIKKATTICLPDMTIQCITDEIETRKIGHNYSYQNIIILCLKKYLKKYQPDKFSNRATCQYNTEKCSRQIKIKLTNNEHHNLKLHRLVFQQSASLLCFLAIAEFLQEILDLLVTLEEKPDEGESIVKMTNLLDTMSAIHRKMYFKAKNIVGLVIVIPKAKINLDIGTNSGHYGRPYNSEEYRKRH